MENNIKKQVILVDPDDCEIGIEEKLLAHEKGLLHRAFSVFVFNNEGKLLLQKRADHKYHSPGLWSNSVCSHPQPGEDVIDSAYNRLNEEMGFCCPLKEITTFLYKEEFDNGLIEHEIDHVLIGTFNGEPVINPGEVSDWKWSEIENLNNDVVNKPELYTAWFKLILKNVLEYIKN
ncbi:isopentenyl-diphosphate Delta-isomerase [Spirochaetota bacterium]